MLQGASVLVSLVPVWLQLSVFRWISFNCVPLGTLATKMAALNRRDQLFRAATSKAEILAEVASFKISDPLIKDFLFDHENFIDLLNTVSV